MRHNSGTALLLLVAGSSAVCAEYGDSLAAGHQTQQPHWRTVDADMSPDDYRLAYRHNQRLVIDIMAFHSKRALTSSGIPEQAIGLLGTAALLPVRDARFHLNRSKTLAVEVQDVVDKDRALFLEFKRRW
jgi:hypothetical protein